MIRFGITGTGRISDWILKGALQDSRFQATAVCSRTEDAAMAFIHKHPEAFSPGTEIFTSVEEMSAKGNIDAVYIGTPNATHLPFTLAAIRNGKHVLCEKPMGMNEEQVRQMASEARERGVVLMEAMISTLNPVFRKAVEKISDIGAIRHYSSSFCQYSTKYDALKEGIVANSFNPQMGGGALPDIGIYTTYPLISLFGYPDRVNSSLLNIPSEFGDVNIHGNVSLLYGGMTADLAFSKAVDSFTPTEICGEKGNIIIDKIHIAGKASFIPHGIPSSGRGTDTQAEIIAEGLPKDEYFYEFEEFMNVIENGQLESAVNSLEISILNARLMDTIIKESNI